MASVQQLEKLYQLQRLFESRDSLEAAVASERIAELIRKTEKLIHQRTYLRDERRRLRISTEQIEERKRALKVIQRGDWVPETVKADPEEHRMINVSGLMFEAPVSVLKRDKNSLLAQLCSADPPVVPDPEGFFYFDRDWWLFRYILNFLRDGRLPDDRTLLAQLYREAGFWHLHEMQVAIEEEKLHLVHKPPATLTLKEKEELAKYKPWWKTVPTWFRAVDEAKKKEEEEAAAKKKKEDWWLDTNYKGKSFLPLSTAYDKTVTKAGEKDAIVPLHVTFSQPAAEGYDIHDRYHPGYHHRHDDADYHLHGATSGRLSGSGYFGDGLRAYTLHR
jgi:hypothetical protein